MLGSVRWPQVDGVAVVSVWGMLEEGFGRWSQMLGTCHSVYTCVHLQVRGLVFQGFQQWGQWRVFRSTAVPAYNAVVLHASWGVSLVSSQCCCTGFGQALYIHMLKCAAIMGIGPSTIPC
jgi:hypothetical protein